MIKLKPCHCGGKASFVTWICDWGEKEYGIRCNDCDADIDPCGTKEEAAEKWNRREGEREKK